MGDIIHFPFHRCQREEAGLPPQRASGPQGLDFFLDEGSLERARKASLEALRRAHDSRVVANNLGKGITGLFDKSFLWMLTWVLVITVAAAGFVGWHEWQLTRATSGRQRTAQVLSRNGEELHSSAKASAATGSAKTSNPARINSTALSKPAAIIKTKNGAGRGAATASKRLSAEGARRGLARLAATVRHLKQRAEQVAKWCEERVGEWSQKIRSLRPPVGIIEAGWTRVEGPR